MSKITLQDWLIFHPEMKPVSSDYYYVKLANKLYDAWRFSLLKNDFNSFIRRVVCLHVTAYFEDVISEIGLWQTFTHNHKKITGKYLPFYPIDEDNYYQDEINLQDISFLVWSILQREVAHETLVNPENPGIDDLARRLFEVLSKEFEQAPINFHFLEHIRKDMHYSDFFCFKKLADWLYFNSYLLCNDSEAVYDQEINTDMDPDDPNDDMIMCAVESDMIFNKKTGPLALPIKEWFTSWFEIIGGMEKEIALISAIETCPTDLFLVNGKDEKYYHVTNPQGNSYEILLSSFEEDTDTQKEVIIASLVKFANEWNVNGIIVWTDKKDYDSKREEDTAARNNRKMINEKFMVATNGYPLAYFSDEQELNKWFSKTLNIDQFVAGKSIFEKQTPIVVFAESEKDISVMPELPYYIKDERNPYYDPIKADEMAISILVGARQTTRSMLRFLLERNMLPDARMNSLLGKERGAKLVQDNVDFITRFFWLGKY